MKPHNCLLRFAVSRALLVGVAAVSIQFCLAGAATAQVWYGGNNRDPAAGVKANIATPNANPNVGNGVVGNWVSNIYFVGPDHYWVQAGWVDGDGVWSPPPQPDGRRFPPYPTVPTSYKEMKTPSGWYDFVPYSAQPLNFARTYECVSFWWSEFGQWGWRIIIAGQNRGEYLGFPRKTRVKAASEVAGSVDNPDSAAFTSVQYKGDYSYMPFDQNSREQDAPFLAPHGSITWTSNSQYTTHANGL